MKHLLIESVSVGIAMIGVLLLHPMTASSNVENHTSLSESRAQQESALYLDNEPQSAHFDLSSKRWSVTDGESTAWLDARTGELVEIEFGAP
ncbi:MAG: hypothetical protein AAF799_28905 [Myxococcota bacterium]